MFLVSLYRVVRIVRERNGATLRAFGAAAATSHSTLSNYEHGTKVPSTQTLERIVASGGWSIEPSLTRVPFASAVERADELAQVLELAGAFPARHRKTLSAPVFGRS
jgi:transcriptional regulator with XRE-family HTH domain